MSSNTSSEYSVIPCVPGQSEFGFFKEKTPQISEFLKRGQAQFWLLLKQGTPIGGISASVDSTLAQKGTGFWGHFECPNDPVLASRLMTHAETWLRAQGCQQMVGPVDLSIYHSYRFQTLGHSLTAHPGEPRNPPHLPELLFGMGFQRGPFWRSWDFSKNEAKPFLDAIQLETAKHEPSLKTYTFKPYDLSDYKTLCESLYSLVTDGFLPNFGGCRPSLPEFVELFLPTQYVICQHSSRLVYDAQGALIAMSYLCTIPNSADTLVYHSFAIDPAHRKSGIGQKLFEIALTAHQNHYNFGIGALSKEGRTAYDRLGPHTREYCVYLKSLTT
jgi:GNAT superfamily N-acetyltransferase